MPAEVPHLRPAGSVPQFLVTTGVGFGRPSPEMMLATGARLAWALAVESALQVAARAATPTPRAETKNP